MTEEIWIVRRVVTTGTIWNSVSEMVTVADEKPFFSKEECEKRVKELNDGNPDMPYLCEQASVLIT
jgi:hypothetical protein